MEKSTVAYNRAIRRLDRALKEARTKHKAAVAELNAAQDKAAKTRGFPDYDTAKRLEKESAQLELHKAQGNIRPTLEKVWADFDNAAAQTRRELVAALEDADTLHAANLDAAAVALLGSGAMGPRDYRAMVADFHENATVLALVRKATREAADKLTAPEDSATRSELYQICNDAVTSGEKFLKSFDDLRRAAVMFSGRDSHGNWRSPEDMLFAGSLDSWEIATVGVIPEGGEDE